MESSCHIFLHLVILSIWSVNLMQYLNFFQNYSWRYTFIIETSNRVSKVTFSNCLGFINGRPSSDSCFVPQLSNQWSPTHSANMWTTAACVMMLLIFTSPISTTGRLFILYLDRSKSIVRNVSEFCRARNGAQRKDPEMSPTCTISKKRNYQNSIFLFFFLLIGNPNLPA